MVDSDEEAAWTMVNKISNLIERAEAAEAEKDEWKTEAMAARQHPHFAALNVQRERAEAAETERHELKNKLAVRQNWQTLYEREKAEVARLREALQQIADTSASPNSRDTARAALAAPTKEDTDE